VGALQISSTYLLNNAVDYSIIILTPSTYKRLHGSAAQRFCNAAVWIAEPVRVKKLEISLN